ncbi:hypothetical protein BDY21DRAFT_88782 [Lineolata rhizophorae]|uniref:GPI anchored protein n=1 Tax=Lineolata rhizophorae TaxID=578093 RepID=A0A6A6PCJ1_9PEZI|nr:hypothetical protein BDY21DRAFT_88782 [Lineolata rhizophorae]
MARLQYLLSLPTSLLLLLAGNPATTSADRPWPYNLPAHAKYYPEDEIHVKRDIEVQERLARQTPIGVRKMSDDEGEKFYLDYWVFDMDGVDGTASSGPEYSEVAVHRRSRRSDIEAPLAYANASVQLLPPFNLHAEMQPQAEEFFRYFRRSYLEPRDFQCPAGTRACTDIDRPNSCCSTDEQCIIVEDTGLGDVGCCPQGASCGGGVSTCNEDDGYTSCPGTSNGGCCIPNYECEDIGCVYTNTATTIVQPPEPSTSAIPSYSSASTTTSSTSSAPTTTSTSSLPSTTSLPPSSTCSPGFRSCPASLGGGCCATDRSCGPVNCPPLSSTSSATANPPARPTSSAELVTTITSSSGPSVCPTGFYMCSAYYRGGCCRVERDCDSTSCPPGPSNTVVDSNGVTILATGSNGASIGFASVSSHCADGWNSCAQSDGGGCCPGGYACGPVCTATVSGQAVETVSRVPAISKAGRRRGGAELGRLVATFGIAVSVGMVVI